MKGFKNGVIVVVAVLFSVACGSSESANTNTGQSSNPGASLQAANSNAGSSSSAPVPAASPANTNSAAQTAAKPVEEKKEAAKPADEKKVDARAIYVAQKCATCHGADGKGKVKNSPDFTSAEWQKKTTDALMIAQIKNGKDPVMPPYAGKLKDAEIKALVGYIRSFAK